MVAEAKTLQELFNTIVADALEEDTVVRNNAEIDLNTLEGYLINFFAKKCVAKGILKNPVDYFSPASVAEPTRELIQEHEAFIEELNQIVNTIMQGIEIPVANRAVDFERMRNFISKYKRFMETKVGVTEQELVTDIKKQLADSYKEDVGEDEDEELIPEGRFNPNERK